MYISVSCGPHQEKQVATYYAIIIVNCYNATLFLCEIAIGPQLISWYRWAHREEELQAPSLGEGISAQEELTGFQSCRASAANKGLDK